MSLDQLNQQLYDPNSQELANRKHEQDQFSPAVASASPNPFEKDEQWERYQKKMDSIKKRKMWVLISSAIFFVLMVVGIVIYQINKNKAFFEDQVGLTFQGPKEADSTQPVKYTINYQNNNAVTLKNVEILLNYPENFQPTENVNLKILSSTSSKFVLSSEIKAHSQGSIELNGVFYAPKDFPVYLRASMKYVPSNGTKDYEIKNQYSVSISSSPVALDVVASNEVADGDAVEYVIDFKNLDNRALKDIKIKAEYPDGFEFESANPVASEGSNIWFVGILDSNQGGKIQIRGIQHGIKDESKSLKVSLGYAGKDGNFVALSQKEQEIKIVSPLLSIVQSVQDNKDLVVKAGDVLTYVIKYQNNGEIGMRDAIITAEIKSPIVDFSKLAAEKASFDAEKGIITWRAADVPALANIEPKATGELRFSIPVKAVIPVQTESDKNFTISSIAKIDSPDIPTSIGSNKVIGSNRLTLKLASKVILNVKGFYKDEKIQNSGPMPPRVGNLTTYVLHLSVASISNDLSGAKIITSLPAGIEWGNKILPENEKVSYNSRTKEIVWDIGKIEAGTGARIAEKEIVFQVGIKPQINQVGQFFKLLGKTTLTAKDAFTGREITLQNAEKDSQLREDTSISADGYKIQN